MEHLTSNEVNLQQRERERPILVFLLNQVLYKTKTITDKYQRKKKTDKSSI